MALKQILEVSSEVNISRVAKVIYALESITTFLAVLVLSMTKGDMFLFCGNVTVYPILVLCIISVSLLKILVSK